VKQPRAFASRLNNMAEPDAGKHLPQWGAANSTHPDAVEDARDFLGESVRGYRGEAAKDWPPPAGEAGVSNCAMMNPKPTTTRRLPTGIPYTTGRRTRTVRPNRAV